MKKETFKIFLIVILVVLLIVFAILLTNKKIEQQTILEDSKLTLDEIYDENGNRVNTSNKMKEAVRVDGETDLEVQGVKISSKDNKTIIKGTIKNTGTRTLGDQIYHLSLKDDTGIEILEVGIYVDEVMAGETIPFQTYATIDLANAYNYTVSK